VNLLLVAGVIVAHIDANHGKRDVLLGDAPQPADHPVVRAADAVVLAARPVHGDVYVVDEVA
jgi:hypothetical protein